MTGHSHGWEWEARQRQRQAKRWEQIALANAEALERAGIPLPFVPVTATPLEPGDLAPLMLENARLRQRVAELEVSHR